MLLEDILEWKPHITYQLEKSKLHVFYNLLI